MPLGQRSRGTIGVVELTGIELARAYWQQVVEPIVHQIMPRMPLAAARLGSGSDVLGLDDVTSRDHDWGLRLNLLVPIDAAAEVDAHLEASLPDRFAGHPTRFSTTWDPVVRHRVQVEDPGTFAISRLGVDPRTGLEVDDWLGLTGQAVLEVTAGTVFTDGAGELSGIRDLVEWYPDDLWRHVVAVDWAKLGQELPFVGRTAALGDDVGSRLIGARLAHIAMHLGFLLERSWPPYSKWLGTLHARLPRAGQHTHLLGDVVAATDWRDREAALVAVLRRLTDLQREVGLPTVPDPVEPFWDRPFHGIRDSVPRVLLDSISDEQVRALPRGVGSVEQWSDNVDVLMAPARRLGAR